MLQQFRQTNVDIVDTYFKIWIGKTLWLEGRVMKEKESKADSQWITMPFTELRKNDEQQWMDGEQARRRNSILEMFT